MARNSLKDLMPERMERSYIFIQDKGVARVDELCELLEVSPATVRRDLEMLETKGRIRRVHGGAVRIESRLDEPLFDEKTSIAAQEKIRIAEKAAALIHPGETVYLDGGSTVLQLARLLVDRSDITVVTNSLRATVELSGRGPDLITIGGTLRRRSQTTVGALTRLLIDQLHVDKAFMGTIGLSIEEGLTTTDADEAFTKKQIMQRADQVILLVDSGKVGKVSFVHAGDLDDLDTVIVDRKIDEKFVRAIRKQKGEVNLV